MRRLLRNPFGLKLIAWIFRYMSFALPVDRLRETASLLAFRHPRPSYPWHVLLVPKKPIASLGDLDPLTDGEFLSDLFSTTRNLVEEYHLTENGYRLIVNGGTYQDFPYLHFHLISDVTL